mmetsp:Transcript_13595/g.30175  ORF Transcript_13595/g.30175 Transcript_13595/m.30175 type:complete len:224 (-) Transcript_13595:145-816(-)
MLLPATSTVDRNPMSQFSNVFPWQTVSIGNLSDSTTTEKWPATSVSLNTLPTHSKGPIDRAAIATLQQRKFDSQILAYRHIASDTAVLLQPRTEHLDIRSELRSSTATLQPGQSKCTSCNSTCPDSHQIRRLLSSVHLSRMLRMTTLPEQRTDKQLPKTCTWCPPPSRIIGFNKITGDLTFTSSVNCTTSNSWAALTAQSRKGKSSEGTTRVLGWKTLESSRG